jgi:protoporphyrinogen oxidase
MKKVKYLILGAGLTGLSLAYHLKEKNYAVYEMENKVGGMCRTEITNGFFFDYGEHFIRADNEYVRKLLTNLLKKNLRSQPLKAAIHLEGRLTNYPFQTNLYGLPPNIIKSCLLGYIQAWFRKENSDKHIDNFEQWIHSNFGDGIAKYFMIPYNNKIWTIHPRYITTDWFFNESVVPKGNLELVIEGALKKRTINENNLRWYPIKGGIGSLSEAFLNFVKNVHLKKKAIAVDTSEMNITFEDGEVIHYENLISTIPLPELIAIINSVPADIKKATSKLMYNSVLCVNLGVARKNLSKFHWIYFPEKKYVFARTYFLSNFSSNMTPEKSSSVSAMITYSKWKPLDKKTIVERVISDLVASKILKETMQ